MAFVDTKERIFVNGQIYSRPIGGGPVHGPDTRRFTPDPNPYDVPPEPRGYGQGTVDDLLFRPGIDKFEIENPVLRPGDIYEVLPLDYLNQYLNNRGITEQNQEVMGSKEQVFPRYANPADGTLTFGAPQGPPHVLVDGPPPRRRPTLFDLNVDWEKTNPQDLLKLQRMIDDIYKDPDDFILNQAEPTGIRMAALDPTDDLLLRSLLKGEIGPTKDPNIRKAIQKLEERKYRGGRADSMEGALMAEMPRRIRGNYRPAGVFGSPPPNFDSPYMDEQIRRGFVPMTPPLPRGAGGPQLPGFV